MCSLIHLFIYQLFSLLLSSCICSSILFCWKPWLCIQSCSVNHCDPVGRYEHFNHVVLHLTVIHCTSLTNFILSTIELNGRFWIYNALCVLLFLCPLLQGWSASGKVNLRSASSRLFSPIFRYSNPAMLKPRVNTCVCCHASWPTPLSMAITWRSLASSCPTPWSTPPPPWKTALLWHSGLTTWRSGPLSGETHWKDLLLLGLTTTTTSPHLHPPSPHQDPPPQLTPLHQAICTLCITTSDMAQMTASMGGRAPEIQG